MDNCDCCNYWLRKGPCTSNVYVLLHLWLPLFSVVLDTPSNGRYRQTSEEINANANSNARCARALESVESCDCGLNLTAK